LIQDFADDEGAVGVYAGGEGGFVALAGPDVLALLACEPLLPGS
jgi:hypothetical protein